VNVAGLKVWIDQDLCTGDGLCAEIAPDVFYLDDDGLAYVQEDAKHFGETVQFNPACGRSGGAKGLARVPEGLVDSVIEASEECPGECIFLHRDEGESAE
jgi:ferredoxin